jgi:2-hydroxychromene-2-carboxylate isomerase
VAAPALYFDLGSPYAYLAFERAEAVLGVAPELRAIVLGPVFAHRGSDTWGRSPARAENMAEVERRARAYGLAPVRWSDGWPQNTLHAMRTVLWAERRGRAREVVRAGFRAAFAEGRDLSAPATLRDIVAAAGLPAGELADGIADPALKEDLKARTAQAIALGVRGAPVVQIGDALFYGDDRLADAGAAARSAA